MPVGRSLAQGGGQGGLSGECYFTAVPRLSILPNTAIPERTNSLQHLTGIELDLCVLLHNRLAHCTLAHCTLAHCTHCTRCTLTDWHTLAHTCTHSAHTAHAAHWQTGTLADWHTLHPSLDVYRLEPMIGAMGWDRLTRFLVRY